MFWTDRIANRVTHLTDQITRARTALIVVDMQNDFVHDEGIFVKQWGKTNHWIKSIVETCSPGRSSSLTPIVTSAM